MESMNLHSRCDGKGCRRTKILGGSIASAACVLGGLLLWSGWNGYYFPTFRKKIAPDVKRVACIGDSITYGFKIKNWFCHHYPRVLQTLLGKEYYVENFGLSGSTGMKSGNRPYVNYPHYKQSKDFLPDIVVIMFGTNDASPANWQGKERFVSEYRELLLSYHDLPLHPALFVMTPPPLLHQATPEDDKMEENIEAVRESVFALADELGCSVIDLFRETKDHLNWFQADGLHPNAEGAAEIARIVFHQIKP